MGGGGKTSGRRGVIPSSGLLVTRNRKLGVNVQVLSFKRFARSSCASESPHSSSASRMTSIGLNVCGIDMEWSGSRNSLSNKIFVDGKLSS